VRAIEAILKDRHLSYAMVDSAQLNRMIPSCLMAYQLFIVPGGNYITIGNSLTSETTAKVHDAVHEGMNYLGMCAGGLLAGAARSNSFNLTSGTRFAFYAVVNQGLHKTSVIITGADATALDQYWEDGPQFTGWGDVVARYPDNTPAIVEGAVGKGWVLLCGVHPEAQEDWRRGMAFRTPASVDNDYAGKLIEAALHGTSLPHY
jgi:glutamine amidotransferase-like uncharacterized protein